VALGQVFEEGVAVEAVEAEEAEEAQEVLAVSVQVDLPESVRAATEDSVLSDRFRVRCSTASSVLEVASTSFPSSWACRDPRCSAAWDGWRV
jgi:hypothetical protein